MSQMLGKLDAEDLARWRMVMADKELIDAGLPFFSVNEARTIVINYYRTLDDIITKYDIEIYPDTHLIVSPVGGHIIRASND